MTNILILPDAHAKPGVECTRFNMVANLINYRRPEVIVCLGDLYDMPSLCSYDYGKKSFEGRCYRDDIESGNRAGNILASGEKEAYKEDRAKGKKAYTPRKEYLIGNHEQRIERAISSDRKLDGTIGYKDFNLGKLGWTINPFLSIVEIEGVCFSHYFITGISGKPISGENPARSILQKQYKSSICGHSHVWDYSERTDAVGKKLIAVVAGCYLEPGQYEDYAGPANSIWWNGLTYLHNVKDGNFDVEQISRDRLYAKKGRA